MFGVITSKQSVEMLERLVQVLRQNKVNISIRHIQNRYEREAKAAKSGKFTGKGDEPRTSEEIMKDSLPGAAEAAAQQGTGAGGQ